MKIINYFLPNCRNEELTLDMIRTGIKLSAISVKQLPEEVLEQL